MRVARSRLMSLLRCEVKPVSSSLPADAQDIVLLQGHRHARDDLPTLYPSLQPGVCRYPSHVNHYLLAKAILLLDG